MMERARRYGGASSLRDLTYILFRRKWLILGVLLSTTIPVTIYSLRIPDSFEAKSSLFVKPGRENVYLSPVGAPEGSMPPTIIQRVAEVINSETEILKSRVVVARAIEKFSPDRLFPAVSSDNGMTAHARQNESLPTETAVHRVLQNLSANRLKGADVIEVGYRTYDPDVAADFLNTLVDVFLERHVEVHQSGQSYEFFKAQSNQLQQQMQTAARRLADFQKKYAIVSFEELKSVNLHKYASVKAEIEENEAAVKGGEKRVEKLKADLAGMSEQRYRGQSEFSDPVVIGDLKSRLNVLEVERSELRQKYKPGDFRIVGKDEAIALLKEKLESEEQRFHGTVTTAENPTYDKLLGEMLLGQANLAVLYVRTEALQKQFTEYGQELERLSRLEPQFRDMQRELALHEQNYRLYISKFEESRVSDAMDAAKMVSVSVIEPATPPVKPIPVNKTLNILVALCVGGVAGLGLAFLIDYFDHSFKVSEDVEENLGVRLLSTIDDMPARRKEDIDRLVASPQLPLHYQTLKSNIMMLAGEKGIRSLCVCSPTSKEGASYVALNLAGSLAKGNGRRVIWIDSNLRCPHLNGAFNLPVSPGLVEVVQDGVSIHEAVQEQPISGLPNLFILSGGASPPNPAAVFESPKMADLIELLKKEFDWVIFDGAPVDKYPDSVVLARQVGGVILVIQAENRGAEVAIRAKSNLERSGGNILGAVLNRRRYEIPEFIYRRL